jgi:hypothetical protein
VLDQDEEVQFHFDDGTLYLRLDGHERNGVTLVSGVGVARVMEVVYVDSNIVPS